MPTFPSPRPLTIHLDVVGDVRIVTSPRDDTVVEVAPANPTRDGDRRAAERTTVQCTGDTLAIKAPRTRSVLGPRGVVTVTVHTPAGASVDGRTALGDLVADGPLGDCSFTTALGDIRLTAAGSVVLSTSTGQIVADQLGDAVIRGAGLVRVGRIDGSAEIRNINGETRIDGITGAVRVKASNGGIFLGRTGGDVDARTALGDVQLGEIGPGTVSAQTSAGDVEVGIAPGVAAWLDVTTSFGSASSSLEATREPERGEPVVKLRGRTSYGNIRVFRAEGAAS